MAINLGEINFGLGPDTTRLQRARQEILRFGQAVNASARAQGEGARATEAAMRRQEKAILSTLQRVLSLNDAIRKTGANPANFNATSQALNRLLKEFSSGKVSALQFQRSLEDVQASLGRVSRAVKTQEAATKQLERSEKESARAIQAQVAWITKQERALFSAQEQVRKFNRELANTKGAPVGLGSNATSSLNALRGRIGGVSPIDSVQFQRATQIFQSNMARNVESLRAFQYAERKAAAGTLPEFMRRVANTAVLINGPLGGVSARLGVLASAARESGVAIAASVLGVGAAIAGFTKLSIEAIAAAKAFERASKALDSLNEVQTTTTVQMSYLMNLSDRSGASFSDLARQFAKITAAAKGTNLAGERTREIFELVTLAGSKMSLTQEEIGGTLKAIEQIISKGTLQMEELRGQLGDRIPGAVQIMARALGISTAKLQDLTKQGKITSDALLPFARELARTYGIELGDSIDTLTSSEGRLGNAILRFNKAMDESLGISKAYKNIIGGMTSAFDFLAVNANRLVQVIVTLGAGFAGLFAPTIIMGIIKLASTIRIATAAMIGLNAATLANPLGALASVIARVTLAVAGAAFAFSALETAMGTAEASSLATAVQANADALSRASTASATYRAELTDQIKMQRVAAQAAWDEALAQNGVARAKYQADKAARNESPLARVFPQATEWLNQNMSGFAQSEAELTALDKQLRQLDEQLAYIEDMRKKMGDPKEPPVNPFGSGDETEGSIRKVAKALREAGQAITDLDAQWQITQLPAGMREWAGIQADANKQIQDFKDKLVDAKAPAATITLLTDQYAASLMRLNEAQYALEHTIPFWESFGEVVGRGLDSAFNTMIDSVIDGKNVLLELRDVGKAVATDLLKTFTQLAVINPLKNVLFGQQNQTMNFGGGGGGIGGLLGGLFGGLFGGGKGGAATGGSWGGGLWGSAIFSAQGNAFGSGGSLLDTPTLFGAGNKPAWGGELDNEAILPLGRTSSGQLGVISAGGDSNASQQGGGDFIANFYLSANGDEAVKSIVVDALDAAFKQYDQGMAQRATAANSKAKFRRIKGAR